METRIYKVVISVGFLLTIDTVLTTNTYHWRLYNQSLTAEGNVQTQINGKWYNTCEGNFTIFYKNDICKDVINNIETNIGTDANSIAECNVDSNALTCKSDNVSSPPCEHATICCRTSDQAMEVRQGCSGNWKYVRSQTLHLNFLKLSIETLNSIVFYKDSFFGKFWTSSAFKEAATSFNSTLPDDDMVRNCANSCLKNISNLAHIAVEIGSCKCENSSYSENKRILEVTDDKNADVKFCISAEVNGTRLTLEAEDCNNINKDYRLNRDKYSTISATSTTTTGARSGTVSTLEVSTTPNIDIDPVKENSLPDWITVFVSVVSVILCIVVILVGSVVYRFRKLKCGPRNSVSNKTYNHNMTIQRLDSGDEYANILDCEVGLELSSYSSKPPLPSKRPDGNVSGSKSNLDVIALDQYSTPHDTLSSTLQDEYSITYDDPIRMNKLQSDTHVSSDEQSKQNLNKVASSDSKEMIKETMNSKSETKLTLHPTLSSSKLKPQHANTEILLTDVEKDLKQKLSLSSVRHSEYEIAVLPSDNDIKKSEQDDNNSDKSEYEICSVAFEKDLTKTRILTEHVCLDCLTPEHLKALGVKIVPDDDYHSHYKDFAKRFSAPCNVTRSSEDAEHDCQTNDISVANDMDVAKRNIIKTMCHEGSETGKRKCSVCHSVYDIIGKHNRHDWIKYTDNVYEKFGNFSHSRPHIGGKRMNST